MMNVRLVIFLLCLCSSYRSVAAQTAAEYNNALMQEISPVSAATAAYLDAATHSHNAPLANAKLAAMLKVMEQAQAHVSAMPGYKGYIGLRDSVLSYLILAHTTAASYSGVMTDEEMMKLSYEKMKNYMETSDDLNDKLTAFNAVIRREQRRFADKNGFIIEAKRPMDDKFMEIKQVFRYYHKVFLIVFKSSRQEADFIDSLDGGNPKVLELMRTRLQQYTDNGIQQLDTMHGYAGDASYLQSGQEIMAFYEMEAKTKFPILVDYCQKKEKFDRQSAAVLKLPEKDRTDKMIESYNANRKLVVDAMTLYNSANQELNTKRIALVDRYNKVMLNFLDKNAPRMQ